MSDQNRDWCNVIRVGAWPAHQPTHTHTQKHFASLSHRSTKTEPRQKGERTIKLTKIQGRHHYRTKQSQPSTTTITTTTTTITTARIRNPCVCVCVCVCVCANPTERTNENERANHHGHKILNNQDDKHQHPSWHPSKHTKTIVPTTWIYCSFLSHHHEVRTDPVPFGRRP